MSNRASSDLVLSVANVSIDFETKFGSIRAVDNVSFEVRKNEFFGIVGESGSGKSTVCRAIMGLLPKTAKVSGEIKVNGEDILTMTDAQLRCLRGESLSMIFQNPGSHLDPLMTVGQQISQAVRIHAGLDDAAAQQLAIKHLKEVHFSQPQRQVNAYPHELSGGMKQRALIAAALASRSNIMIADEPTTALDVTVQAEILQLLKELREEKGLSIILISHDLGVISQLCDRLMVMKAGAVVEMGHCDKVLSNPDELYTRQLIQSRPENLSDKLKGHRPKSEVGKEEAVIEVKSLSVDFGDKSSGLLSSLPFSNQSQPFRALDKVSLQIHRGDVVGIVGESGSGKSTLSRAIMGLITPTEGHILFEQQPICKFGTAELLRFRRKVQMVFQHPLESLDPHFTVHECIAEPLRKHRIRTGAAIHERVEELMRLVELPVELAVRKPHHLSGGQCQRVCIARALAMEPEVLVADEITSALDVTIQAQILSLLGRLQRLMNLTVIFVTHDLGVVKAFCSEVVVVRHGHLIEQGRTAEVFDSPKDEYTRKLLAAVPKILGSPPPFPRNSGATKSVYSAQIELY